MTTEIDHRTAYVASKIARVQGVLQGVDGDFETEIGDLNKALQVLVEDFEFDSLDEGSYSGSEKTLLDCPIEDCPGKRVKKEDNRFSSGFRWECNYCTWRQDG